jgi:hypothetical protein
MCFHFRRFLLTQLIFSGSSLFLSLIIICQQGWTMDTTKYGAFLLRWAVGSCSFFFNLIVLVFLGLVGLWLKTTFSLQ